MLDHKAVLLELSTVLDGIDSESVDKACKMIIDANVILLYGCG